MEKEQSYIGLLSILATLFIAIWQIDKGEKQSQRAADNADQIAMQQNAITVQLDQLEQWRKQPFLEVLKSFRVSRDTVNCIVQNTGGRDLVLMSLSFKPITPLTESKSGTGLSSTRQTVETADRSKVHKIDVSMKNLAREIVIDPAVIVKPGESLTLKFIFPNPSPRCRAEVSTNAGDVELFDYETDWQ